ncbi:MAG: hypothetical protein GY782_01960 [Gammaproteobacteria bacterium]|nr:hypothetical protein [Gammaproteobacteria bacterium]
MKTLVMLIPQRILFAATLIATLIPSQTLSSNLIPSESSDLYYEIGGGNDIPLPAFYDSSYIPLNANAQVGLGFNCGIFNPQAALTNSLNQIKHRFSQAL